MVDSVSKNNSNSLIVEAIHKRANLLSESAEYIAQMAEKISIVIADSISNGGRLFFCGNGGSAAESQHMAAEYCATLDHTKPRKGMPAMALTTDTSFITAWSNDFGYDGVFLRQIETLSKPGDVMIAYSTSGNSKNVCLAAEYAMKNSVHVIGFTGNHPSTDLEKLSNILFQAPSKSTPLIQEIHTIAGHEICYLVEKNLFNF